jgi:hypothetical protein
LKSTSAFGYSQLLDWGASVKMLAEYLDTAIKFEQMAAAEKDPNLKADFERQAAAYRKLAEKRAKEYGLKTPPLKNA